VDEPDELAQTAVVLGKPGPSDAALRGHLQMVVIGNGILATHPLPDHASVTIGRSRRCDISIEDESLSRRHATVELGEVLSIVDLGSVNGTRVRGARIDPGRPAVIAVGELIGLGTLNIILQERARPMRPRRLWTHDYFEARLEEECAREERTGAAFALLRVQFEGGTSEAAVEELLGDLIRDSDILGRYGPSDYEILLPDTPPERASEGLRRIEAALHERGLRGRGFLACCPRDGRSPYQLIAHAQAPQVKERVAIGGADIVVTDAQMQSLHRLVDQIAGSQIGVLILGETGVGKEVFARAVHRASPRAAGPFVELNCAALPETLLESELFGHEKGAFTNALAAKPGLIESAHGGTLLLDEVGDMPLATQVKLLRAIEGSQLRRVGGLKSRPIDVRFVAATNSDLEAQMEAGTFRRDLFYRLNGVTIVIPPLRQRLAELEPLAHAFINRAWPREAGPPPALTPEALSLLRSYRWPGNVRELKNVMERAVLLCGRGPIRPEHLPHEKMSAILMTERPVGPPRRALSSGSLTPYGLPERTPAPFSKGSQEEQRWILQALERAGGNQTVAARLLGISRRTLVNRLNDYNLAPRPRKDRKRATESE
jgi:DNA-binding NtrC family response regulator